MSGSQAETRGGTIWLKAWLWPERPRRCVLVSLCVWPGALLVFEILAIAMGSLVSGDLALALGEMLGPFILLYSLVLWFRVFVLHVGNSLIWGIVLGILASSGWILVLAVVTMLFFPLGRINPDF